MHKLHNFSSLIFEILTPDTQCYLSEMQLSWMWVSQDLKVAKDENIFPGRVKPVLLCLFDVTWKNKAGDKLSKKKQCRVFCGICFLLLASPASSPKSLLLFRGALSVFIFGIFPFANPWELFLRERTFAIFLVWSQELRFSCWGFTSEISQTFCNVSYLFVGCYS